MILLWEWDILTSLMAICINYSHQSFLYLKKIWSLIRENKEREQREDTKKEESGPLHSRVRNDFCLVLYLHLREWYSKLGTILKVQPNTQPKILFCANEETFLQNDTKQALSNRNPDKITWYMWQSDSEELITAYGCRYENDGFQNFEPHGEKWGWQQGCST